MTWDMVLAMFLRLVEEEIVVEQASRQRMEASVRRCALQTYDSLVFQLSVEVLFLGTVGVNESP